MKKPNKFILLPLVFALMAVLVITGCGKDKEEDNATEPEDTQEEVMMEEGVEEEGEGEESDGPVAPVVTVNDQEKSVEQPASEEPPLEKPDLDVNIQLFARNDSGQSGPAIFTRLGEKTKVTIRITNPNSAANQPAQIVIGSCTNRGATKHILNNLVNGVSQTILNVTVDQLKVDLPLAVVVSESMQDMQMVTSCGNISL